MMEAHEAFNACLERFARTVLGRPGRERKRRSA